MYIVISKWEFDRAHEAEVDASAESMMKTIADWPEVAFAYNVRAGDDYLISVIGYSDEETYKNLVQATDGPFERAAKEHGIERYARWVWSERGERVEHKHLVG